MWNHRIRKVTVSTGIITSIAGSGNVGYNKGGFSGDGGAATSARLNDPLVVALDIAGMMMNTSVYSLNHPADPLCMRCIYHRQRVHC